jgi:hypothetical protein
MAINKYGRTAAADMHLRCGKTKDAHNWMWDSEHDVEGSEYWAEGYVLCQCAHCEQRAHISIDAEDCPTY